MAKKKPKKTVVRVKAWVIADGANKFLTLGAAGGKTLEEMFIVYQTKNAAEDQWGGMHIIPATITYSI